MKSPLFSTAWTLPRTRHCGASWPQRLLGAGLFTLALGLFGCATTGNIDPRHDPSENKATGLVLFSVSHDKDTEHFFRRGANIQFSVHFRDAEGGTDLTPAFSNDTLALIVTTQFENVWGRAYARELAAGRYELSGWTVGNDTGVGARRIIKPNQSPRPIPFEVKPGSVTYIGNVHGALEWGNNLFGVDLVSGARPQIRNEADRDLKTLLRDYPQLAGKIVVAPLPVGSWSDNALHDGKPSVTQLMQACLRYEEPLAMQRLAQGDFKSRQDATAFAQKLCAQMALTCASDPNPDKCRVAATPFGLATEKGPSASAAMLLNAATKGDAATVKHLLTSGADTNVRNAVGWTPLMLAAAERHTDTVAVLLGAGADPNAMNALGRTALMFAASYGQDAIVKLLLEHGAKPNVVPNDQSGWTALMAAAARGHASTVDLLLRHGADSSIQSKDGRTARDLARAEGRPDTLQRLSRPSDE